MIVTLTPNPSVDHALVIDELERGEVLRAADARLDAGGKGVNVSRALAANGAETVAVVPVGGHQGHLLADLLGATGVSHRDVPISGAIRMNVSVLEPDGTTTKLNEPGPVLSEAETRAMVDATLSAAEGAAWVAVCGSLPPGVSTDVYSDLADGVRARGARFVVDSSGAPFLAAVATKPNLIKPNHEELAELVGHDLPTLRDVLAAARELVTSGIEIVAVSLGADGALLVTEGDAAHAQAKVTTPVSTVGAGDCMLAGLLHGLASGLPISEALVGGVAWGSAAVALPGSSVPTPDDVRRVAPALSPELPLSLELGH
ncbi:1-phosphofructokinase [Demequina zhanjiangensis]|uniref:1-phosphofructokinase n=1 Tax=Demequina zhanjiangensis TaxID=3051659 RepID=A0ABT8G5T2_9MICO|nr:1-phosphofructokinase [Demequina sp. SYSU T00b26]MDN4474094.1 1-phosphofructokinase [Demequina sp. SYSU T00b26]